MPCRLFLDSNPPAVLVGALLTASQLARLHRDNYAPLATAAPYPQLRKLLIHSEPAVRARVCNLLGNMCRHSAYFYTALDRHGLLPPLIQRCMDDDRSTRKFACFAIGNAGELSVCACLCAATYAHPYALDFKLYGCLHVILLHWPQSFLIRLCLQLEILLFYCTLILTLPREANLQLLDNDCFMCVCGVLSAICMLEQVSTTAACTRPCEQA